MKDAALQLNISYDAARKYKSEALRSIRRFLKGKLFSKMLLLGMLHPCLKNIFRLSSQLLSAASLYTKLTKYE